MISSLKEPRYQLTLGVLTLTAFVLIVAFLPFFREGDRALKSVTTGGQSPEVTLEGRLEAEGTSDFSEFLTLIFTDLRFRKDLLKVDGRNQVATRICVKSLGVDFRLTGRDWEFFYGSEVLDPEARHPTDGKVKPACAKLMGDWDESRAEMEWIGVGIVDQVHRIAIPPELYYEYPFERIILEAILQVRLEFFDESEKLLLTAGRVGSFRLENDTRVWETINRTRVTPTWFTIEMRRPRLVRYLTVFLLIPIVLIPFLIAFVDTFGTAVEVAIAVFLSLWGVRQFLLPEGVPGFTLIDVLLLGEYGILTFALLGSAYLHAKRKRHEG